MSAAEGQKQILQAALVQAIGAMQGLNEEQRAAVPTEALTQLEQVVSYAQLVVERTRPELISTTAHGSLNAAVAPIAADPLTCLASPQAHADAVINALSAFPISRGRGLEQVAQGVIGEFEKAASERIAALQQRVVDLGGQLETLSASIATESARLGTEIETAGTTLKTTVETLATTAQTSVDTLVNNLHAKVTEFEGVLTAQRAALDEVRATQSEQFSTSQGERATAFQQEIARAREELTNLDERARDEVETRVAEIRRMEDDASKLVGAIGLAGTAERYGEEAKAQKKVADWTRGATVLLAIGAVVMAIVAATNGADKWHGIAAKLAVSAVFGGLATYMGKQSARHRAREERARNLQLELTAFAPFIEPLDKDQQDYERVIMTRKTFGHIAALPELQDDHAFGPLGPVELVRNKLGASGSPASKPLEP
jgi:hypothetical protein